MEGYDLIAIRCRESELSFCSFFISFSSVLLYFCVLVWLGLLLNPGLFAISLGVSGSHGELSQQLCNLQYVPRSVQPVG